MKEIPFPSFPNTTDLKIWESSNGRFDWLNRFDDIPLFIKRHVESRDVPKKLTQHLYYFRFSRRFVLVRVGYLSSLEAYTNNWGLFGKENYLTFDWWKHLFDLLESWDVRALSIRKTADLPLQICVGTFPRFVAIGFYFLSETLI